MKCFVQFLLPVPSIHNIIIPVTYKALDWFILEYFIYFQNRSRAKGAYESTVTVTSSRTDPEQHYVSHTLTDLNDGTTSVVYGKSVRASKVVSSLFTQNWDHFNIQRKYIFIFKWFWNMFRYSKDFELHFWDTFRYARDFEIHFDIQGILRYISIFNIFWDMIQYSKDFTIH